MDDYVFVDALSGDTIAFDYETGDARLRNSAEIEDDTVPQTCTSIFFPGCSFINYAMPLVEKVYKTLSEHDMVDGISLLCCGRILSYEPNGAFVRAAFEEQLRDRVAQVGIKRIYTACPNCLKALRTALGEDERTADIELFALPCVLADLGYRIDRDEAALLLKGDSNAPLLLCPHDSCPDRDTGEIADGLRELLPEELYADPAHCRSHSLCCGSLVRAAGKFEAADKLACRNGQEAVEVGADAIVTSCMSCVFQLTVGPCTVPAVHFLELLYSWRVDWESMESLMKLRFLFDETLGVIVEEDDGRTFKGLGAG